MDIIIDNKGDADLVTRSHLIDSDDDDIEFENTSTRGTKLFDIEEDLLENDTRNIKTKRDVTKDIDLEEFEEEMGWSASNKAPSKKLLDMNSFVKEVTAVDKILETSVITPGFEKLDHLSPYELSTKELQRKNRKERAKTKGKDWFNMPAPEMTPEVRHDLQVIQMRSVLDPKHFYKKNDRKGLPKYFHIGKVVDTPVDYYSSRLTMKERKKTIVDELLADAEFSKYNKRKYKEIIDEKKKLRYKAQKHAKRLKGKKK